MRTKPIPVVRSIADVRAAAWRFRDRGEAVALVPTMGALHEGHLALVRLGAEGGRRVVVSIFVNPRQFAENEDLGRYPRHEATDVATLATVPCDVVWAPTVADVYPPGFSTRVELGSAADGLESEVRPGHFGGVATVCLKLFAAVEPHVAVFGEKDYQQLCVIRQMVRDLNLPLEILAAPTVREADGLALSSRNVFLTPAQRKIAPRLHRALGAVADGVRRGESAEEACAAAARDLIASGFAAVDYIAVRDGESLGPAGPGSTGVRVLGGARLDGTRLIDNIAV